MLTSSDYCFLEPGTRFFSLELADVSRASAETSATMR